MNHPRRRSLRALWVVVVVALVMWFGESSLPRWWLLALVPVVGWFGLKNWRAQRALERGVERQLMRRLSEHRS